MKALYITYMSLTEPLSYSQVLSYLNGLAQRNTLINILSFEKEEFCTKEKINEIKRGLGKVGIKWSFLRYHKNPQFLAKTWDILSGVFVSFFIALKERVDVIHARNTICAFMGILPVLVLKKSLIFDMRGFMAEEYADANLWEKSSLIYKVVNKLERYFAQKADENIVLTEKARDYLIDNYLVNSKNINIISTCVNLEQFKRREWLCGLDLPDSKRFTIIYTGSLGTWYMLQEMLSFFNILYKSDPDAVFIILTQTEKRIIKSYIPEGLIKNIRIEITRPEQVPDFLNTADAGIFFIKPCLSKMFSCPTKFAEYLACGLPVVINKGIGDTEKIVRDNRIGVIIENFTEEGYRLGIERLRALLKEGNALKERCVEVAGRYFSLEQGIDRYSKVYAKLK